MPTRELWADETIVTTTWIDPLTSEELGACFNHVAQMIAEQPCAVNVLFDLRQATNIPTRTPILAIQSGFLTHRNTECVAIITSDMIAEILASIAARITRHEIRFFSQYEVGLAYFDANVHQPTH